MGVNHSFINNFHSLTEQVMNVSPMFKGKVRNTESVHIRESHNENETTVALQTIFKILKNISSEHGIVNNLALYPTKNVMASILALSRLQHASLYYEETQLNTDTCNTSTLDIVAIAQDRRVEDCDINHIPSTNVNQKQMEIRIIGDIAHYAAFANAAYGWKMCLLSGELHWGNMNTLMRKTGVKKENVVTTSWKSDTNFPAFFIVRDVPRENVVLCIRGTLNAKDVLTDLCCISKDFRVSGNIDTCLPANACGHQGMIESARRVASQTQDVIALQLASYPTFHLVIVGHSLGGGIAAVLGTMWKQIFPGLIVYTYGCPCAGPLDADPVRNDAIVSVIGDGDPFSCLSLGHLADISSAISHLCNNHDLRNEILTMTTEGLEKWDLYWCWEKMDLIRKNMVAKKFYPPGKILYLVGNYFFSGNNEEITLRHVSQDFFQELKLHPFMFDLSRHIPNRYEIVLRKLWINYSKDSISRNYM